MEDTAEKLAVDDSWADDEDMALEVVEEIPEEVRDDPLGLANVDVNHDDDTEPLDVERPGVDESGPVDEDMAFELAVDVAKEDVKDPLELEIAALVVEDPDVLDSGIPEDEVNDVLRLMTLEVAPDEVAMVLDVGGLRDEVFEVEVEDSNPDDVPEEVDVGMLEVACAIEDEELMRLEPEDDPEALDVGNIQEEESVVDIPDDDPDVLTADTVEDDRLARLIVEDDTGMLVVVKTVEDDPEAPDVEEAPREELDPLEVDRAVEDAPDTLVVGMSPEEELERRDVDESAEEERLTPSDADVLEAGREDVPGVEVDRAPELVEVNADDDNVLDADIAPEDEESVEARDELDDRTGGGP